MRTRSLSTKLKPLEVGRRTGSVFESAIESRKNWEGDVLDLENMKTDHQDFRIPNELVLGKKLKMNGKTIAGLDKILGRQFSLERNVKNLVNSLCPEKS